MDSEVIGWAVWITKPEYMVDREEFFISEGYEWEDVLVYVQTLDLLYGWYINITEYRLLNGDDFYEHEIKWRK